MQSITHVIAVNCSRSSSDRRAAKTTAHAENIARGRRRRSGGRAKERAARLLGRSVQAKAEPSRAKLPHASCPTHRAKPAGRPFLPFSHASDADSKKAGISGRWWCRARRRGTSAVHCPQACTSAGATRLTAAMLCAISSGVCALETKPASKADGARYTPSSSMAWKKRLKRTRSQAMISP